ncbi:MAG: dienelactone hydrolase family protein [Methylococcales symbiont of Hymedesmia sp. n. MRB-2018]|nr:MAG: dienelactone hydrolase family protein [Methylococcales symbiont of Hymedesmia sp. n. MRB-2018]KAF3983471.1 MAG: dienelactone hydrolase family protein [Methylococcales symbiont of Hymedesmia sp. n. MRB-2018]
MAIISNTVDYLDGDVLLEGFFAYDDSIDNRRPAVQVNHAWAGRNSFVQEKAIKLAELGYFAFAADMYGKGVLGQNNEENASLMQPFMDDRTLVMSRMNAALYAIKLLPWVDAKKIAAIGFCFGGLCVLDLARSGADIKGVVSFHGLLGAPESEKKPTTIKSKVLVLHGADDPMGPVEQVIALQKELTEAKADWQIHNYGHTLHAFTNPMANDPDFGTVYQADADRRSWASMKNFLAEVLK